jgi:hypothetical protein
MLWRKGGKKITVIGAEFDEVLFTDVLGLPARRAVRVLWFWHFIAAQESEHHFNHLVRAETHVEMYVCVNCGRVHTGMNP